MNPVLFTYLAMLAVLIIGIALMRIYWKVGKSGAALSFTEVLFMMIRKTANSTLLNAIGQAQKHQLEVSKYDLESLLLAGGNPLLVVNKWIEYKDHLGLNFKVLRDLNLEGADLDEQIRKGEETLDLQVFKIPVSAFYVDAKVSLSSFVLGETIRIREEELKSMIDRKLRLDAHLLQGAGFQEANTIVEEQILGVEFWQQHDLILRDLRIRIRTADQGR